MDINSKERDFSRDHYRNTPIKFVCPDCVEDEFLKSHIQQNAQKLKCDYCNNEADNPIAAPVKSIVNLISRTMDKYLVPHDKWYDDMIKSGLPSKNLVGVRAMEYPLYGIISYEKWNSPDLREDVKETLSGAWQAGHSPAQRLGNCWNELERTVKTRTRYFFANKTLLYGGIDKHLEQPVGLLEEIGQISEDLGLYQPLSAGTSLHRVRETRTGEALTTFDTLGPPPEESASAGRMNPAGISYFYLANERKTAIGEVLNRPPCKAAIAKFSTKHGLLVLDLTELPSLPSMLDLDKYEIRQSVLFLEEFVKAITLPVSRDGREHIDYVPSQVVSEFFTQVFRTKEGHKIDGMIYPSAVVPDGKNVVLFPPQESTGRWEEQIELTSNETVRIADWSDLTDLVSS